MLVLARKKGEVIMIGEDISIIVIDIRGGKARLGIEAPKGVAVNRKEIHDLLAATSKKTLDSIAE